MRVFRGIFLFGISLFSEDRSEPPLYLHEKKTVVIFMIFAPTPFTVLYTYLYLIDSPIQYFFEWIMLFCIFIWLIPFCLRLIRILNSEQNK